MTLGEQLDEITGTLREANNAVDELIRVRRESADLRRKLNMALEDLQTAVNECCLDFWNKGHGARVEERWNIRMQSEEAE